MVASFLETGVLMPQSGPQEAFAATKADIAIYGGAAGGGKTMGLIMEPLRHIRRTGFSATLFRRTYPEIMMPGGLWDTASMVYPAMGAVPRVSDAEFVWPEYGSRVKMAHMQHEKDKFAWQSSQLPLIELDELTHFTESQFWYMLSRNRLGRPMGGLRPYVRAACNPMHGSWVEKLIEWWINQKTGLPIPERSGVLRYFVRQNGKMIWADTPEELAKYGLPPKSFTFISSTVYDNKLLLDADPGYLANLQALPSFERAQLLEGNWKVTRAQGDYFRREFVKVIDAIPAGWVASCRYWDRAASEANVENPNPDYTAGVKLLKYPSGKIVVADVRHFRARPAGVQEAILAMAMQDGQQCIVGLEQDPGSAGAAEIHHLVTMLQGFNVRPWKVVDTKHVRWLPFAAQWEHKNIEVLRAPWNDDYFNELESLGPDDDLYDHDDQADASAGAFHFLSSTLRPTASVA